MNGPWTPADFLMEGRFASRQDLLIAVEEYRRLTGGPVIVVTFSSRWLVRSLSLARTSTETTWCEEVIDRLQADLYDTLSDAPEGLQLVPGRVAAALAHSGCDEPHTTVFGEHLERPGHLGVVVGGPRTADVRAVGLTRAVAECVLGSRPAAFSSDTALDLVLRRAARAAPDAPDAHVLAAKSLLEKARSILDAAVAVAYEASPESPHRFVHLDRLCAVAGQRATVWVPSRVDLVDPQEVPTPPELGGACFDDLGELVNYCFNSAGRPRRLVGTIAGEHAAYGVPYGFDDVRRRPVGVLCLVWPKPVPQIRAYEFAAAAVVAKHLARGYDVGHTDDTVRLVTSQLSFIADLGAPTSDETATLDCDPILAARNDVRLIAPTVAKMVRGMVNLSGAMSVTCRLIAGADGDDLSRYLVRLHCEGDECASNSPERISVDDVDSSVNAWVAMTGKTVHLRRLEQTDDPRYYDSVDLPNYPGLDRVRIYRNDVACELCVPIFAEQRLVGTVNLEADRGDLFSGSWKSVEEYAQIIGVALLEARRRISVDAIAQAGGVLDYRHSLEGRLIDLRKRIPQLGTNPEITTEKLEAIVKEILDVVYNGPLPPLESFGTDTRVGDVITQTMRSVAKWGTQRKSIQELTVDAWTAEDEAVYSARLDRESARALTFALSQALHNVRKHAGRHATAGRRYSAMFRFGELEIGGKRSLYVAVSSTCSTREMIVEPQRVFREPIPQGERVSLGAFLAGEALRRCGGSAYLRVRTGEYNVSFVDAEFSVPAA